jgi:hypothetical protein
MECSEVKSEKTIISGRVTDAGGAHGPIRRAEVRLSVLVPPATKDKDKDKEGARETRESSTSKGQYNEVAKALTDDEGRFRFTGSFEPGATHKVEVVAFGMNTESQPMKIGPGETHMPVTVPLNLEITTTACADDGSVAQPATRGRVGRRTLARLEANTRIKGHISRLEVAGGRGSNVVHLPEYEAEISFGRSGVVCIEGVVTDRNRNSFGEYAQAVTFREFAVSEPDVSVVGGKVGVALERTAVSHTLDQALWVAIRNRTRAISFGPYRDFIDRVLRAEDREITGVAAFDRRLQDLGANLHGVGAYQLLKTATEVFLLLECGVRISQGRYEDHRLFNRELESDRLDEFVTLDFVSSKLREYLGSPPQLPYITRVVEASFPELSNGGICCDRVATCRINEPCLIELIWSYWHEEGMLVQTMNAVNRRFQNVRAPGDRDPLANFELDPLRRVGNLLWGQIQDELNQLSVKRRAYEYSHHYGLSLYGRAAGSMRPADNRSKFLEAFHNLLHLTSIFYKEDNDTTVIADGFPLLNALTEVHLILAQGAHNQFGDLPWTARAEMMAQEYIIARPEIREFLQSRHMVPYKEPWMPQVDTMKTLQGWSDVTVTHFRDLGVYGEQILLSIRYGDWIDINDEDSAKNWARYWRPEIQGYLHAYRAVTGVDLTNPDTVDATVPAIHLQKRLAVQQRVR